MTNRVMYQILGALLGILGALAAALAFVAGLFWLADQSSVRDGGMTLLIAVALLLCAVGAGLARRALLRMSAQWPQAEANERAS